jgi:uncharacterized membrane protein (DUF2068 family)
MTARASNERAPALAAGVRAIVGYKTVKAALQLGLVVLLCALWPFGLPEHIQAVALALRQHLTQAWAHQLADFLATGMTERRLAFTVLALGLDGTLTGIEAWALHRGRWWGPWLVVAATGALLPFEVYAFFRVPRLSRALLFTLNLAILLYVARRATTEHRRARAPSSRAP